MGKRIFLFSCLLCLLIFVSPAYASPQYTITALGTLAGDEVSTARSINDSGQAVGYSVKSLYGIDPTVHATLFSNGTVTDLGTLPGGIKSFARSINNSGQAVGYSWTSAYGGEHATLFSNGTVTDLGPGNAYSINNSGQAVGYSGTHATLFSNGTVTDLGTLPGYLDSFACSINDSGQAVGYIHTGIDGSDTNTSQAVLFNNGTVIKLGILPGFTNSFAYSINNSGQAVGSSSRSGCARATLFSNGTVTDLGTPQGFTDSTAWSINNSGQAVGYSWNGNNRGEQATLFSNGIITNLNSLIDPASGWTLHEATCINDAGQIVGTGMIDGQSCGFLLTPIVVPVPNVVGMTDTAAESAISSVGLTVGTWDSQYSSTVPINHIISQNPPAGTSVPVGSSVTLTTSLGSSLITIGTATYGGQNYKLIYEANQGLVWLDYPTYHTEWYTQMSWVAGLNNPGVLTYNINPGINLSWGVGSNWRLPKMDESVVTLNGVEGFKGPDQNGYYDYEWGFHMLNSEMGHLYYVSLGNTGSTAPDGAWIVPWYFNPGPFTSFRTELAGYWECTDYSPDPTYAWAFGNNGSQAKGPKHHEFYALAVRPAVVTGSVTALQVPNVVGMTQAAASSALTLIGLTVGTITQAYSSTVTSGSVISQDPPAGTSVPVGSSVTLTTSLGPQNTVAMPDVTGKPLYSANPILNNLGIWVYSIVHESSPTVYKDYVIRSNPPAGINIPVGSWVELIVSTGPPPVTIPNVVGITSTTAQTNLTALGLRIGSITKINNCAPFGQVIDQYPAAGTVVSPKTDVYLTVSTGPVPLATIPNLRNKPLYSANPTLNPLGLWGYILSYESSPTIPKNYVIRTDPAAGNSLPEGSWVGLVISSGP